MKTRSDQEFTALRPKRDLLLNTHGIPRHMPEKIDHYELHRHIDVSTRIETLFELAQKEQLIPQSTSLEGFRQQTLIAEPMQNLTDVLERFMIYARVLTKPEYITRITEEVVEDCVNDGLTGVELRYSPTFASKYSNLSWQEVLESFQLGLKNAREKYPQIKTGLICILGRNEDKNVAEKVVEFFLQNKNEFIAFDLADNEIDYPCHLFTDLFKRIRESGTQITVHAGEAAGPENIWEAIELLGAERIGHGVTCIEDPQLMRYLAENKICLEVCPTSNYLTQSAKTLADHQLPTILENGVPTCINTDDPGIFNTTLTKEVEICRTEMGLTKEQIESCRQNAVKYSFLE